MINQELLEILACPACREPVKEEGTKLVCTNSRCALQYSVRDGIPVMLVQEARRPGVA